MIGTLAESRNPISMTRWPMRVLLLGDYRLLVKALKQGLEEHGFTVDVGGGENNGSIPAASYDAIVLDLTWARSGLSLVERWRRAGLTTHVLALAAPDDLDQAAGLSSGVSDWLSKPFELDELLTRLRAVSSVRSKGS